MWKNGAKRVFDFTVALLVLPLCLTLMAGTALLIRIFMGAPVLFRQERLGRDAKIFNIMKFRSMTDRLRTDKDHVGLTGPHPEVTRLGAFLRRSKLDELPQLFHILKGEMSWVGPRPGLPNQLEKYDERLRHRLDVLPGLTGLAQVHGSIFLTWPQRWEWDLAYVERISFALDMWILVRTCLVMLLGEKKFLQVYQTHEN